jgi:hypothetical protein
MVFLLAWDGQLLMITNASANELVINLESTDWGQMADGSQFYDPNGAPVTMSGDGFVLLCTILQP